MSDSSFVAIVPARFGSTRFPGKPLIDIGGKPMVVRVAEQAQSAGASRVVVATDDERIVTACREHGVDALMTRADHPTGTDRLSEVVGALGLADETIVVNVQGDEPLIPPTAVSRVADLLRQRERASIATLAHPISDLAEVVSANVVKCVLDEHGFALYFSRAMIPYDRDGWRDGVSKLAPEMPVYRHIGLYAYRAAFLRAFPQLSIPAIERFESLEQLRALAHGYRIAVGVVDEALPPGIDTPEDYERLRHSVTSARERGRALKARGPGPS